MLLLIIFVWFIFKFTNAFLTGIWCLFFWSQCQVWNKNKGVYGVTGQVIIAASNYIRTITIVCVLYFRILVESSFNSIKYIVKHHAYMFWNRKFRKVLNQIYANLLNIWFPPNIVHAYYDSYTVFIYWIIHLIVLFNIII